MHDWVNYGCLKQDVTHLTRCLSKLAINLLKIGNKIHDHAHLRVHLEGAKIQLQNADSVGSFGPVPVAREKHQVWAQQSRPAESSFKTSKSIKILQNSVDISDISDISRKSAGLRPPWLVPTTVPTRSDDRSKALHTLYPHCRRQRRPPWNLHLGPWDLRSSQRVPGLLHQCTRVPGRRQGYPAIPW